MQPSADRYPAPWRIVDHDGRIMIVAANAAKVTEVQPGQLHGHVPSKAERVALAQRMVDAANRPGDGVARFTAQEMIEMGVIAEPLRSPDAPWLKNRSTMFPSRSKDGA